MAEPEAGASAQAAVEDVHALLGCGVPFERILAIRPHGLPEQRLQEIAKAWVSAAGTERSSQHSLDVASAVLHRSKSALRNPAFCSRILEGLEADAPEELKDPLFYTLMRDPVVLSTGIVVDRTTALNEQGQLRFHNCPFTRESLYRNVYPLIFLKERLVDFVKTRLDHIFKIIDTALAEGGGEEAGRRDLATAAKAVEVGCSFLKDIGKHTYATEAERMQRLRLQILEAADQRDPKPWSEAYGELCALLRLQAARVDEELEAAASTLCSKAASCLPQGPQGPALAVAWLQALCELAVRVGTRQPGPRGTQGSALAPRSILLVANLLLQAAKRAASSDCGNEGHQDAVDVAQARTAMYLALKRTGAEEAEIDAYLQQEGVSKAVIDKLLQPPHELIVRDKLDVRSDDSWITLGTLECGPDQVTELRVSCEWKDQCWGNKKGAIKATLRRGDVEVHAADLYGICMDEGPRNDFVPAARTFTLADPLVELAALGDAYVFEYMVGGGGGHTLHIRNFVAQVVALAAAPDDSGTAASAAVAMPPVWLAALLGVTREVTEVEYVDSDGDVIVLRLEGGQLVKYVNGQRLCGGDDATGVVTQLRWSRRGAGHRLEDQHGWGGSGWGGGLEDQHGRTSTGELLQLIRALAERAGVPHNILGEEEMFAEPQGTFSDDMDVAQPEASDDEEEETTSGTSGGE